MYEIRIKTETREEANEIIKVIDREESEGSLLDFTFITYSPVNIADACCEAGAD
jgi:hypothetical protein